MKCIAIGSLVAEIHNSRIMGAYGTPFRSMTFGARENAPR